MLPAKKLSKLLNSNEYFDIRCKRINCKILSTTTSVNPQKKETVLDSFLNVLPIKSLIYSPRRKEHDLTSEPRPAKNSCLATQSRSFDLLSSPRTLEVVNGGLEEPSFRDPRSNERMDPAEMANRVTTPRSLRRSLHPNDKRVNFHSSRAPISADDLLVQPNNPSRTYCYARLRHKAMVRVTISLRSVRSKQSFTSVCKSIIIL